MVVKFCVLCRAVWFFYGTSARAGIYINTRTNQWYKTENKTCFTSFKWQGRMPSSRNVLRCFVFHFYPTECDKVCKSCLSKLSYKLPTQNSLLFSLVVILKI